MDSEDNLNHITTKSQIIRFAIPSIIMMLAISSYTVIDGTIVSHLLGTDALAAINIAMPAASVLSAFGFMLSSGGSALAGKLLGEENINGARQLFTGVVAVGILISLVALVVSFLWSDAIVTFLGADETLVGNSSDYLRTMGLFSAFFILQYVFTQFLVVAGKPTLSLAASLAGGVTNIILDFVFMGALGMGLTGAAVASGIGAAVASLIPIAYFILKKDSPIRFAKPCRNTKAYVKTCTNGASEMVSQLSGAITGALFNLTMMSYIGPDGVAAITIVMYVEFLAVAVLFGYSMGTSPLMSYNYGAGKKDVMNTLFRTGLGFSVAVSVIIFISLELLAPQIVGLISGETGTVYDLAVHGARIFAVAYLFLGVNCFASALFTSLNNGLLSALISFLRGLCILAPSIIALPLILGADGIWIAVPITEILTFVLSAYFIRNKGETYGYLKTEQPAHECARP